MKPIKRLLLASLLLCSSTITQAAEEPFTLKLLCNQYPPFAMSINDTNFARGNDIDGINVDIIRELMKRAEVDYNLTMRFPYKRLLENTRKRAGTGVFTVNRTPEREALYRWVGPINDHNWVLVNAGGLPKSIKRLSDIKGIKVAVQKGETIATTLRAQGIDVEEVTSARLAVQRLASGQVQYWASAELPAIYFAQQENQEVSVSYRIGQDPLYLALNPATPDAVVTRLQQAIEQMRRDGTLEQIRANYL